MTTYTANQVLPIPHLHLWATIYDSVIASVETSSTPSSYYLKQGYLFLGETSLDFTVRADFNEVSDKISALEGRIALETKEFQETIGKLKAEITKLQAIENTPKEVEQYWYFTFGSGQRHPTGYVKLFGTWASTRERMNDVYDKRWAFQYTEDEFLGQEEKYNLTEVDITEDDIPF